MSANRTTALATLLVVATGVLWGFYWLPVRQLAELGLPGAWGSVLVVAVAVAALFPFAWAARGRLKRADRLGLASVALGGFSFVLYSMGLNYGRVAIVIVLFFLTPVWSTLIGRLVLGWPVGRMRAAALAAGCAGFVLVLGADGEAPLPEGLGEWLALASGFLWAVATTGIRMRSDTGPAETAFVFAAGALAGALVLAPLLEPFALTVTRPAAALFWALAAGVLWWGASMAALGWAAMRLDPARVGILLMAEVLVGAASAAMLAGDMPSRLELAGGALIVLAGALEVWPQRHGGGGHGARRAPA